MEPTRWSLSDSPQVWRTGSFMPRRCSRCPPAGTTWRPGSRRRAGQGRPAPPVKLTLFDDFAATLPMADVSPPGGAGGATAGSGAAARSVIVVHRSPMLDSLAALFEAYWQQAVPLVAGECRVWTGAPAADDPEEERLVRLLAAGFGNDAIQRAMGLSASTVQRRVHELMERLGAKTRFQAGLMLGRMSAGHRP